MRTRLWLAAVAAAALSLAGFSLGSTGTVYTQEPIAPPDSLFAEPVGQHEAYFEWQPGSNNVWFCVNLAESFADLADFGRTWRNHGCWTETDYLDIAGLRCGTLYFWNVYAWNLTDNTTSEWSTLRTPDCGTVPQLAPIAGAEVTAVDGRYVLNVAVTLLDECHGEGTAAYQRDRDSVKVFVWNFVQLGAACDLELTRVNMPVDIGPIGAYTSGVTYRVNVNNHGPVLFTAH